MANYVYALFYSPIPNSSKYNTLVIKKRGGARWWPDDTNPLPKTPLLKEVQIIDFPGMCVLLGGEVKGAETPIQTVMRCLEEQTGVKLQLDSPAVAVQKIPYIETDTDNNKRTCLRLLMSYKGLNDLAYAINNKINTSERILEANTKLTPDKQVLAALYAKDEIAYAEVKPLNSTVYDLFNFNTEAQSPHIKTFPDGSPFDVNRLNNDNTFFVNTIYKSIPYSVYACVFYQDASTQEINVLVAKKNVISRWVGKDTTKNHNIVNNPGQWVLPGGKCDVGELAIDAAIREFEEETGKKLDSTKVSYQDGLYYNTLDKNLPLSFVGVYFNMGDKKSFDDLITTINGNLSANSPTNMHTDDDELAEVQGKVLGDARQLIATTLVKRLRGVDPKGNTDWFEEILQSFYNTDQYTL